MAGVLYLRCTAHDVRPGKSVGSYDISTNTGTETIGKISQVVDQIYQQQPTATVLVPNMIPWLADPVLDTQMDLLRIEITIMVND